MFGLKDLWHKLDAKFPPLGSTEWVADKYAFGKPLITGGKAAGILMARRSPSGHREFRLPTKAEIEAFEDADAW